MASLGASSTPPSTAGSAARGARSSATGGTAGATGGRAGGGGVRWSTATPAACGPGSSPPRAMTSAATPPTRTAPRPTAGQRRPARRDVVVAAAAPEIVEGNAGPGGAAGVITARTGDAPTMPRVRCTEIAAWAGDCAYGASATASSAVV